MDPLTDLSAGAIIDSLSDGLYVTDRERRIRYWNRAAQEITGWTSDEILGRSCYDNILVHVDKDDHPLCGREYCPLHRAIVTGTRSTVGSIVFAQTRDGGRVPLQVSVAPVRNERGETVGGVEVFRDLSSLWQDLERARRIQQDVLAFDLPRDPRATFQVLAVPLDQVGGDFHRVERIDEDHVALMVADVVGHGVAAALYSVQLRTFWEDLRSLLLDPVAFLQAANQKLLPLTEASVSFATCLLVVIDLAAGTLTSASAGHCPGLILRAGGAVETVSLSGSLLGLDASPSFGRDERSLGAGDLLLLYSDGAAEVGQDADHGKMLGTAGLGELAASLRRPGELIDLSRLEERLLQHAGTIRLGDDLTLIQALMMPTVP